MHKVACDFVSDVRRALTNNDTLQMEIVLAICQIQRRSEAKVHDMLIAQLLMNPEVAQTFVSGLKMNRQHSERSILEDCKMSHQANHFRIEVGLLQ